MNDTDPIGPEAWPELLLAGAGWIADEDLDAARVAPDRATAIAAFLAGAARVGIDLDQVAVEAVLRTARPGDALGPAQVLDLHSERPRPRYRFRPLDPMWFVPVLGRDPFDDAPGAPLDLTGIDLAIWPDQVALTVVRAVVETAPAVAGVWAAWRTDRVDPAETDDVPVFLIESAEPSDRATLTRRIRQRLTEASEMAAQVEVFQTGDRLPDYHLAALGSSALIWARSGVAVLEIVPVYDDVDPKGPWFAADHPRLTLDESPSVAAYLYAGELVQSAPMPMSDVVDASRGRVVPMSFRTDGAFIWPEAAAYYAREYGLAPDPTLLAAIREAGYARPQPDGVAVFRAEAALRRAESGWPPRIG
jgi:hypothetical protein